MWQRRLSTVGVATLLMAIAGVPKAGAAEIVNGGFETGDFTGWTVQMHSANAPGGGSMQVGAQVLTGNDFFQDGSVQPGITPPQGGFFALLSTMPGATEDEPDGCPTTQSVYRTPPDDVDSDPYWEQDVTVLSQQFTVSTVMSSLEFSWSVLLGESGPNALHDDLQVTLTPINPPGPPIQLLGLTAGSTTFPLPYTGTFQFINPGEFDSHFYEVLTDPAGGPTDCHFSPYGRTVFRTAKFPIPGPGLWEVTFFVGDDGGDGRGDTGVLLDNVTVTTAQPVPAMSGTGIVALVCLLLLALVAHAMRRRSRPTGLFFGMVLLAGAVLVTTHLRPASGALTTEQTGTAQREKKSQDGMLLAVRRTPRLTPPPTRQPTPPPTNPATPTPVNTPTPIVSHP